MTEPRTHTQYTARTLALEYGVECTRYFEAIRHLSLPILLDSNGGNTRGRFDLLSAAPIAALFQSNECRPRAIEREAEAGRPVKWQRCGENNFAETLRESIQAHCSRPHAPSSIPFVSGAIGIFSYQYGEQVQRVQEHAAPEYQWPAVLFGIYQWAIVIDHQLRRATLVADPRLDETLWQEYCGLCSDITASCSERASAFTLRQAWSSNLDKNQYTKAFDRVQSYIAAGDTYQVNLAQRFTSRYDGDPWQAYRTLRQRSPAPFSAYFECGRSAVGSLSPERFIEVAHRDVTTQPIKGTAHRSVDTQIDQRRKESLRNSDKDRAENLMIVDLMRNDIGRFCETGTVRAPQLFDIESYANVHHMVSTVTGRLRAASDAIDLINGALPGGSITGAPKIRSMQIIRELEPHNRSVYCGTLAWFDSRGYADSSILIRTVLFEQKASAANCEQYTGHAYCWGGGGIVSDSTAEQEYQESCYKVENLLSALQNL